MLHTTGHHRHQPRQLIEATAAIDLRWLKRHGQILPTDTCVTLCTPANGRVDQVRLVHLERPVFGGVRTYFLCPACERRCEVLYWRPELACRVCHDLAYACENASKMDRALYRLQKRRHSLGQTDGRLVVPFPGKPKWWRWPRYLRLRRQAKQREREYWRALRASFGGRLGR